VHVGTITPHTELAYRPDLVLQIIPIISVLNN
jgi:hypothetical protein